MSCRYPIMCCFNTFTRDSTRNPPIILMQVLEGLFPIRLWSKAWKSCITENDSFVSKSRPSQKEHTSSHKDNLVAKSDLPHPTTSDSALESSPESRVLENEEIQPLEPPFKFEDGLFEDFGNTSNYFCKRKPPVPIASTGPIEAALHRENVKKLMSIMSSEWSRELELS